MDDKVMAMRTKAAAQKLAFYEFRLLAAICGLLPESTKQKHLIDVMERATKNLDKIMADAITYGYDVNTLQLHLQESSAHWHEIAMRSVFGGLQFDPSGVYPALRSAMPQEQSPVKSALPSMPLPESRPAYGRIEHGAILERAANGKITQQEPAREILIREGDEQPTPAA